MDKQNKQPRPHAELIHAWADGAKIQYRVKHSGEWLAAPCPTWTAGVEYRIKPEEQKNAPKRNDGYFYVDDGGVVRCTVWNESNQDFLRLDVGNVYYTQSVANGAAERVRAALKGEKPEGEKSVLHPYLNGEPVSDGELALIRAIRKAGVADTWESNSAVLVYEDSGDLVSRKDIVAFVTDGTDADDDEVRKALYAISWE